MDRFDIVFSNGTIYDGSGSPSFTGSVGVRDGRLSLLPSGSVWEAERTLDATGLAIAPGFIDVHSHTDFQPFVDSLSTSKAHDGVTLEISGNCGFSAVPFDSFTRKQENERYAPWGASFDWANLVEYRAELEASGISIHHAMLVGHGNLRSQVMGEDNRDPTAAELDRMKGILGDLLDQGAVGLSSGLIYPPGCFSKTDELTALARVAAEKGRMYTSHIRGEGANLRSAITEVLTIARDSGARTQISHLKASGRDNWHKLEPVLEEIEATRSAGYPVLADRYPYTATNTYLYTLFRNWAYEGGRSAQVDRLKDPAMSRRILDEMREDYPHEYVQTILVSSHGPLSNRTQTPPDPGIPIEGSSLGDLGAAWGQDAYEAARLLSIRYEADVFGIFFNMNDENLRKVLTKDWVMIASDGSAQVPVGRTFEGRPHPRAYGTFSRAVGHFARDEGFFGLETAIHKMTGMPATHFGLEDRGTIRDGAHADLTIFDPASIVDRSTYADPHQLSQGVITLVVGGQIVLDRGMDTGARPGRVL